MYENPQQAQKKSNKLIIGIIVAACVVLLLCCGGIGWLVLSGDPDSGTKLSGGSTVTTTNTTAPAQPAAEEPKDDTPKVFKLGETAVLTEKGFGTDNEIQYTAKSAKTYAAAPDDSYWKPEKGVFVAVDVEVKVIKGSTYACSCDFVLVTKDGTVYEPTVAMGFKNEFNTAELRANQRTGGLVVFDVPKNALDGSRFELRENIFEDTILGYWELNLK